MGILNAMLPHFMGARHRIVLGGRGSDPFRLLMQEMGVEDMEITTSRSRDSRQPQSSRRQSRATPIRGSTGAIAGGSTRAATGSDVAGSNASNPIVLIDDDDDIGSSSGTMSSQSVPSSRNETLQFRGRRTSARSFPSASSSYSSEATLLPSSYSSASSSSSFSSTSSASSSSSSSSSSLADTSALAARVPVVDLVSGESNSSAASRFWSNHAESLLSLDDDDDLFAASPGFLGSQDASFLDLDEDEEDSEHRDFSFLFADSDPETETAARATAQAPKRRRH